MLKGPRGEQRPADRFSCAVTVARVAPDEIEDKKWGRPDVAQSGRAGDAAPMPGRCREMARQAVPVLRAGQ